MKTLIVGTGVIGTLYGSALAEKGADITHLVRKGRKQKFSKGINLDIYDIRGEGYTENSLKVYVPKLIEDISKNEEFDLILIPVRETQIIDTLRNLKEKDLKGTYFIFTNNWKGTDEIDKIVPRSEYICGYAGSVGGFINNQMILNITRSFRIGLLEGNDRSRYDEIVSFFNIADFEPDVMKNIIHWLWVHHAIIAGLTGIIYYSGDALKMTSDDDALMLMINAVREGLEIVKARGVKLENYPNDTNSFFQDPPENIKLKYEELFSSRWGKRSIEQSHLNTNTYDMKLIFQDVYETGKQLDIRTPAMDIMKPAMKIDN